MRNRPTGHLPDARRDDRALWPSRVGPWFLPAFWLTIVVLACLQLWLG
jgi:hypothetical protein